MKTEKRLPTYKAGGQTQPALSRATAVIDTLSHFHSGALGRPRLNNNFPSWHPSEKLKKKRSLFLSLFLSICQAQSISRGPWGSLPRRSQPQAVHARPFGADFRDRLLLYPGTQFSRHIQVLGLLPPASCQGEVLERLPIGLFFFFPLSRTQKLNTRLCGGSGRKEEDAMSCWTPKQLLQPDCLHYQQPHKLPAAPLCPPWTPPSLVLLGTYGLLHISSCIWNHLSVIRHIYLFYGPSISQPNNVKPLLAIGINQGAPWNVLITKGRGKSLYLLINVLWYKKNCEFLGGIWTPSKIEKL